MEVETAEHDTDIGVEHAAVGDVREILRLDVATECWVCSANVRDTLSLQLLLNTRLSKHEHLVLRRG